MTDKIAGVILAGGLATRMGGGDKCLKLLAPQTTLLDVVVQRFKGQIESLAINASGEPSRFSRFNLPILPDQIDGYAGPLAGILAGLNWAKNIGASHVVSVAGDTPFFPRDLVAALRTHQAPSGLAIAASADRQGKTWRQPTFGIWPVALKDDLERAISKGGVRKIVAWTDAHGAGQAFFDESDGVDPFFNVNTPEDLERACLIAAQQDLL